MATALFFTALVASANAAKWVSVVQQSDGSDSMQRQTVFPPGACTLTDADDGSGSYRQTFSCNADGSNVTIKDYGSLDTDCTGSITTTQTLTIPYRSGGTNVYCIDVPDTYSGGYGLIQNHNDTDDCSGTPTGEQVAATGICMTFIYTPQAGTISARSTINTCSTDAGSLTRRYYESTDCSGTPIHTETFTRTSCTDGDALAGTCSSPTCSGAPCTSTLDLVQADDGTMGGGSGGSGGSAAGVVPSTVLVLLAAMTAVLSFAM